MWTATTIACFPLSCCFWKVGNVSEKTHPPANYTDWHLTSSTQQLPRKPSLVSYHVFRARGKRQVAARQNCFPKRVIVIVIIILGWFSLEFKLHGVLASVYRDWQSSLLTKGLHPGCSPQPASFKSPGALGSPGTQTGGSSPPAAAESTTERKAGLRTCCALVQPGSGEPHN